ncbi:MAG: DUF1800 family protein [Pseudomonadota bacterium]
MAGLLALGACSGGGSSVPDDPNAPPPPQAGTPSPSLITSDVQAQTFLMRSTFGGTSSEISSMVGRDATDWLRAEYSKSPTLYLPPLLARQLGGDALPNRAHSDVFWASMIGADDPLRQRMVFALSQILVISDENRSDRLFSTAHYMDILSENAFGNYRNLLEDITYSPAMARYLTYLNNQKGDERSGRMPDENYARELLQLFTIGVVELNIDGTVRTDGNGRPLETYTNEDVVGLAKVFTGLSLEGPEWRQGDEDADYQPLKIYPERHSELDKTFLGLTIPAGTGAEESIDMALDQIFEHPNVGPFLARQLIQRFTMSNPSPEYVERVAIAFNNGVYTAANGDRFGTGVRGDLQATLAAVLLDQSLGGETTTNGKVREPILRFVHWARAFNVQNTNVQNERRLRNTTDPTGSLGQHPFRSPSVFNFYRPGYVAPNTQTGEAELTAPEFQIVNEGSAVGYLNFMTDFVLDRSSRSDSNIDSFLPDYSRELALADDPQALVDHLDMLLTGNRMSDATRSDMLAVVTAMPLRDGDNRDEDLRDRVYAAVLMAVTSPAYAMTF